MPSRKKKILKRKKKPIRSKCKKEIKQDQHEHRNRICNRFKPCPHQRSECCPLSSIKRIRSPLVKLATENLFGVGIKKNTRAMEYKSPYRPEGLSPKERCYIIYNCQAKSSRYKYLKCQAAEAIRDNKIFSISGSCNPIRNALLERGWIEKLPACKMNLTKIKNGTLSTKPEVLGELERLLLSNLVEKYSPNFIWHTKEEIRDSIDMMRKKNFPTIVNKLMTDVLWTSKQGLCSSMKGNYWFYIEEVAEVVAPRSYNTGDPGEAEGFVTDYRITACTSLLKWVLSMVANERPVFIDSGNISLSVILFALNRCKEYLYRKENKDIDRSVSNASQAQWNAFLKKYYRIIGKDDVFQADTENKLPLYMAYAEFLLKQMHKYRPQLSCEGCHNIWIIKPAHNSRGRGIRMASRLTVINDLINKANAKYVIQKYIEEPLLIHETKFDIRQYCLVTSTFPLVIWMYKDCYLKFSSQKYNLNNYHESIHLTNNAVQRKYVNCAGRHEELPSANMWHSDKYKDYLKSIDKGRVWDKLIYPGMKKSIVGIMLSCQDSLPFCKNRFELYGCDFILDKEYKPWLIEINSHPDLNPTTPVTAKICPAVLTDIIKVVIDHAENPKSPTGKFECIYRQPMTAAKYGGALDLFVQGYSLPNEYFYKGKIDLRETYDCNEDMEKENNIKAILDKIKQEFDSDTIMVEPEDDTQALREQGTTTTTHHSQSEHELSIAASVITEQLDELLDRIVSEHIVNLKSKQATISIPGLINSQLTSAQSRKKEAAVKSLLDKSLNKFISLEASTTNNHGTFDFSELDDGPLGKASVIGNSSPGRKFSDFKQVGMLKLCNRKSSKEVTTLATFSTEVMLEAATKLISFINKKEKEYFSEHKS